VNLLNLSNEEFKKLFAEGDAQTRIELADTLLAEKEELSRLIIAKIESLHQKELILTNHEPRQIR